MALSGGHTGTANGGFSLRTEWSATQNTANNTSYVTVKTYLMIASGWSVAANASKSGSVSINGTAASFSKTPGSLSGGKHLLSTNSRTVAHNTDGTKSFSISAWYDLNVTISGHGWVGRLSSGSKSYTLNPISRGVAINSYSLSNVTSNSVKINFTTSRAISRAQYQIGSGSWVNTSNGATITGLSPNTTYKIRIWVEAKDSGVGTYSGYQTITTSAVPVGITSFSLSNTTFDSTQIYFSVDGSISESAYQIDGGSWISTSSGSTITGLSPDTSYEFRLRVRAANGGLYSYSAFRTIRTLPLAGISTIRSSNIGYDRFSVLFSTSNADYIEYSLNGSYYSSYSSGQMIYNLTPGSTNTVRVRVRPSNNDTWIYSNTISVKTLSLPTITSFSTSNPFYDSFRVHFATSGSVGYREVSVDGGYWRTVQTGDYIRELTPGERVSVQLRIRPSNYDSWTYSGSVYVNTTPLPKVSSIGTSNEQVDRFTLHFSTTGNVGFRQRSLNDGSWLNVSDGDIISGLQPGSNNTIQVRVRPSDYDTWSYSNTIKVPTIKLSTATIKDVDINGDIPVVITRLNSNVTHTVFLYAKTDAGVFKLITTKTDISTGITIVLTEDEKDLIYSNRVAGMETEYRVSIESFWSGSQGITNSEVSKITFSNVLPTIGDITYGDINPKSLSLTEDNQKIVQNQSDIRIVVSNYKAQRHAKVVSSVVRVASIARQYSYNLANVSEVGYNLGKIDSESNTTATITIVDSRGFTATKSVAIQMIPYKAPSFIAYEATRDSGYEDDSFLNYKIEFSTSVEDSIETSFRIKEVSESVWSDFVSLTELNGLTVSGNRTAAELKNYPLGAKNNQNDYDIEIKAVDYFGDYIQVLKLTAGSGLLIIDREGWSFQERVKGTSSSQEISYLATIKDIEDASPLGAGITGPPGPTGIRGPRGEKGDPFRFEDFTPQEIDLLRGEAFTFEDFTPAQLEMLKGKDGAGHRIEVSAEEPGIEAGDDWYRII